MKPSVHKASGLTIKDWCEQNGISPNTCYYYLGRIRDTMLESSGPRLVEMELSAANLPAGKSAAQDGFLPRIIITLRDCVIGIGGAAFPESCAVLRQRRLAVYVYAFL